MVSRSPQDREEAQAFGGTIWAYVPEDKPAKDAKDPAPAALEEDEGGYVDPALEGTPAPSDEAANAAAPEGSGTSPTIPKSP